MNEKLLVSGVLITILICLIFVTFLWCKIFIKPPQELKLSDFPEVFKSDTLIVIGDGASAIEIKAAENIASYLENETGNKPLIKKYSEVTQEDKERYNLIVIGTLNSNPMLREVHKLVNALRISEEFPGEGKGILEILRNPWNRSRALLLVVGQEYKNPDKYSLGRGVDIMKQILLQKDKIKKIKVGRVYGPYDGWKPNTSPGKEGFPNPAALYCKKVGYCGSEKCDRWKFFSGLCDEEHTYCSKTGGVLLTIRNWCPFAPVCAICILPSGKICYEFDYAMGACR